MGLVAAAAGQAASITAQAVARRVLAICKLWFRSIFLGLTPAGDSIDLRRARRFGGMNYSLRVKRPPGKLRIIGGEFRSRIVEFDAGHGVRPTPDRVRQTVFRLAGAGHSKAPTA